MTSPFDYPNSPHQRRRGPRGYTNYESYRPWLRDEFAFRCVYCLTREAWGPFIGVFALDHFRAASLRPERVNKYENLLYSCVSCNLSKGRRRIPDPTTLLLASSVQVGEDGTLHADSSAAAKVIDLVGLNRPRMREFRALWISIIRLVAVAEPDLHRRLLSFPNNLPDLKRLRPPGGNTHPKGVAASHLARRLAGTLPETY